MDNRKISALTEAARAFVSANYVEEGRILCNRRTLPENHNIEMLRPLRRDRYNYLSIADIIRGLSYADSTLTALQDLENYTNMSFVDKMLEFIRTKNMRETDVYKAAQIDRRLFSKIISDRSYKPAKDTCIALSLALHLSLSEANDFLARAGYVLSHSNKRDIVIEYFFREHIYDLNDVNEILFHLEQKLIGR